MPQSRAVTTPGPRGPAGSRSVSVGCQTTGQAATDDHHACTDDPSADHGAGQRTVQLNSDLTFDAEVGGVTCSVTLDTGSSINIIHRSVLDVLPRAPPLLATATVARTVSSDPLPLLGRTRIALKIAGRVVVVPFYVSDQIDCNVLLGLEFFGTYPCVLDLTKNQLILRSVETVRSISAAHFSVGKVLCQRDISVPAGHEMFFPGFVANTDFRGPVLCEPMLEVPGLEFLPAMVNVRGQSVPCIVRNITTEPITIPKRSEIGRLEVGVAEVSVPSGEIDSNWRDKINLSDTELNDEQKEKVKALLDKYSDMFDGRLGFTSVVEHSIDTGDSPPIRSVPHRVPPFLEDKVRAEIQRLVDLGVLEESNGYWSSPACFVAKKDGRIRVCADLRKVNAVTKMPAYPVPRTDAILDSLGGNAMFCVLDLRMCYFQIGVKDEDRPKTTIVTPFGAWQHRRLPMGLNGAAASCARMLDIVLRDLPKGTCHSYFDDVCLAGKTFTETLDKLELVLDRLHKAGLTINLDKCSLFRSSVKFLGHIVNVEGLSLDPDRVSKVHDWPIPRTAKQLSSFLGLASYMRKFVKNFASIAAPLFKLVQKDVKFHWTEEAQFAFDRLRKVLSEAPVLTLPDFSSDAGSFILECDCSDVQAGAVLLQVQNGVEKVIAYGSQKLSKAQMNYGTTQKELLAVVLFVQKFSAYLLGKEFKVRSDHASLKWLLTFRNPSGMLARWFEILSQFHFSVEHRPGALHKVPDALSRRPTDQTDQSCQTEPESQHCFQIRSDDWSTSYLRSVQDSDSTIAEITKHLSAGTKPKRKDLSKPCHAYLSQWARLRLIEGVLFRAYRRKPFDSDQMQVVLPQSLISGVLTSLHAGPTGGHFASDKLLAQARLRFWWPGMSADIEQFCKSCRQCGERNKPIPAPRASLGQLPASAPMEMVALDILSGLPVTSQGHKHLLVIVDHFSRFVECIPLKTQEATEVAQAFVREFVSRYGVPKTIHSDLGGCFTSEVMKLTCQLLGMGQSHTTAFHPMGNSICERVNRSVLSMLSKFLDEHEHSEWDVHLPLLLLGLRSQVHRSLGASPYCVMFGREPRLPADVQFAGPTQGRTRSISEYLEVLQDNLRALHKVALDKSNLSHKKNKLIYDRKINEFSYLPGDKVYLHKGVVPRGQYYKFLRPWKRAVVVDQVGPLNYRIRLEGARSTLIVHHNRLKPRVESGEVSSAEAGQARATPDSADTPTQIAASAESVVFPACVNSGRGGDGYSRGNGRLQCNGRLRLPAEPLVSDSRPLAISFLNPFAMSFTPRPPSVPLLPPAESMSAGVMTPSAELSLSEGASDTSAFVPVSERGGLRRSTRVKGPPDRFVPG